MEPTAYIAMYRGTSGSRSDPRTIEIPEGMYPARITVTTSILAHHAGWLGGSVEMYKRGSDEPFYTKSYSRSSAYQSSSVTFCPTDNYNASELLDVEKVKIAASGYASSIGGDPGTYSWSKVILECKYIPWQNTRY